MSSRLPFFPQPKPAPRVIAKQLRKKTKEQMAKDFRDAVWTRDKGASRATGKPVVRGGTTDATQLGEVDHAIPRSLAPDRLYDVTNGILLSKEENRLRKAACRDQPEFSVFNYSGPDDRSLPQTFVWREWATGKVIRTRIG